MTRPSPRFVPADATASLLERLREESEGVVVHHQLAKGSIDSSGSASSSSPQGGWPFDAPGSSRGPEGRALSPHLRSLQSIGIIEFLEQDNRATFVLDLSNPVNAESGSLSVLFSNAAMRASEFLLDLLSPDVSLDPSVGSEFDRFKAWAVNQPKDERAMEGLSLDAYAPSISYGGVTWSCSTLRKRYRVVSANRITATITPTASPSPLQDAAVATAAAVLDERARGPNPDRDPTTPHEHEAGRTDYFGTLAAPPAQDEKVPSGRDNLSATGVDEAGLHIAEGSGELSEPSFDWTRIAVHQGLTEHYQFARSVDWAATPLGPIDYWPSDLRVMSNLVMGSPQPAAMYWGREFTAIYNSAYVKLAAKKHPMMMGKSYKDVFPEIWDAIEPVFDNAWFQGKSTSKYDNQLFLMRDGFLEECYFNWSIIPLVGGDGKVCALFNPAQDTTSRKVNERRMLTLREIGAQTSPATEIRTFWSLVLKAFEYNEYDIPMVMIYSTCIDEAESEVSSLQSGSFANPPAVNLEGALGVPAGHPSAVQKLELRGSEEGFAPYMRESLNHGGAPIVLDVSKLPPKLVDGLRWRGFTDPSTTIVVFPVHPTPTGDAVAGFIVMGTNPRRPYDQDFKLFIQLLSRQLSTSMAAVALFEEEIRKGQRAARMAALDRQELSLQLRLRTQEAVESEYKFSRMAEFAPVGMFITDNVGNITYCNDCWYQISRHSRSHGTIGTWMQSVREEDRSALKEVWEHLVRDKIAVTHEFRFQHQSQVHGHTADTWVLMSAFPERDESGDLKRVFGCMTDITPQKWAETFQRQRTDEAVELKRQREEYIDLTSHEMRNPLSAILQCSDEITNGLSRFREVGVGAYTTGEVELLVDGCLEAASTIALCASHQKRIVDDTLTFSKLDSQLISVTAVNAQPSATVRDVLKMFEPETRNNNIRLEFQIDKSYEDLEVDWVKIDPSRLRQILINLMTNAIKFTTNVRASPCITVSMGASRDEGDGRAPGGLDYIPSRSGVDGLTDGPEWGTGEKIFLHFAVTDTGPGLDDNEKKLLFQRFSQASPRTHVDYGGFGLGLYICRTLSELQGGQISVMSEKGVGSTFAFYIKARKVNTGMISPPPQSTAPAILPKTVKVDAAAKKALRTSSSPVLAGAAHGQKMQPLDVLIVEDNLVNQRVLQRQLIRCGNRTLVANHGQEALAALRRSRFWRSPPKQEIAGEITELEPATPQDSSKTAGSLSPSSPSELETNINISVILMDLEMPVMDGMTCARRIRELEREGVIAHHIPIIAVTAYARPEQIATAKEAGIDDVISKPFRIPELIPKIEELVRKYNADKLVSMEDSSPLTATAAA